MNKIADQLPNDVKSVFDAARRLAQENDHLRAEKQTQQAALQQLESDKRTLAQRVQLLENENAVLLSRLSELVRQLAEATDRDRQLLLGLEIKKLQEQLAARNREVFGPSRSERRRRQDEQKEPSKPKPKTGHGRTPQPRLLVEIVHHKLDEADRVCPSCGANHLPEWEGHTEDSEEIDIERIRYKRKQHRRQKYRCVPCGHIETALGPDKLAPGCRYSIDLSVEVAVEKHGAHVPLPRQVERMESAGLTVTTQTLWDMLHLLHLLLLPTFLAHHQDLLTRHTVLGADETSWRLMTKGPTQRWWAWILSAADGVVFLFSPTRGQAGARKLLGEFSGTLVVDAFSTYIALERYRDRHGIQPDLEGELSADDKLPRPNFQIAACWDHARRPLFAAERSFPEAGKGLDLIGKLYAVEAEATRRAAAGEDLLVVRQVLRNERSRAIVAEIKTWRDEQKPLPGLKLAEAVGYLHNQWARLNRFLDDPAIPISNIRSEQQARSVVLNRNNSIGSRSVTGCRVSELMLSLIGSCRLLGLDPRAYLSAVAHRNARDRKAVLLPREFAAELAVAKAETELAAADETARQAQEAKVAVLAEITTSALARATAEESAIAAVVDQAEKRAALAEAEKRLEAQQDIRAAAVTLAMKNADADRLAELAAAERAAKLAAEKQGPTGG